MQPSSGHAFAAAAHHRFDPLYCVCGDVIAPPDTPDDLRVFHGDLTKLSLRQTGGAAECLDSAEEVFSGRHTGQYG